ncbi:Coenzyme A disulfide reductase [Fervidicola ferrireducens]|uniref:Coenzyme A disulfide reductase n=1 Tax=Fervidicola ferrireducens TaxID=520764 RepID=A0A140L643_9FIRM|nr:Coenzyme A disulfide reductase [Fervidicola ferrireducens]
MGKKVLIVGGVAGGASAAARLRRLDESAEIIMFERGEYVSFANCGLPYYVGEVIAERKKLLVQTPENFKARFNIDVRVNSEVTRIFPDKKQVEVREKDGRTYIETYDYLILSPGASPVRPPIPGIEAENIFTVRTIPDVDRIKDFIEKAKPKRAVVVGGGFIGLEMAENLHARGIKTTIVEMLDQVLAPLDFEMAAIVHGHIRAAGVDLVLKDGVKAFINENNLTKEVELQSGRRIPADLVVLAIGVKPEVKLAKEAGLEIGERGGIRVNEKLQTSDPYIFAIGDAIEVKDFVTGQYTLIPLAGPANKQGRIVADIIAGRDAKYEGTQGTAIVKIFDCVAASTGANEKTLKRLGIPHAVSFTHPGSHAGYYPGSTAMSIKLIFDPETGKVLGAQIVGKEGVDKRIDVIASAIRRGDTVFDLQELELAYAPPFSSAKDPVNMAGYVAGNIITGDMPVIQWHEIENLDRQNTVILDVRTKAEYELGHIEGSVNIPVDELRTRLSEIPRDKEIVVYCQVGLRAYIATRILMQNGYKVKNLSGGWKTYKAAMDEKKKINDPEKESTMEHENHTSDSKDKTDIMVNGNIVKIDARGLQCPGPIVQVFQTMKTLKEGTVIEVAATDPGFLNDIRSWCETTGNELLKTEKRADAYIAYIRKGAKSEVIDNSFSSCCAPELPARSADEKTMVVFSGDLDKAIAAFIIANGAASTGKPVTMFFTFWGLNILRKDQYVPVKKGLLERMFGMMMPRGSKNLPLSKMNMLGIGPRMIRMVMRKKNISSLEELIEQARRLGVRMVACNMSMDVMGIKREELIDGVEIGGVATFLNSAEKSNMTLFI